MLALTFPALLFSMGCGLALAAADYFRKAVPLSVPTATVLFYFLLVQIPLMAAGLTVADAHVTALSQASYWLPALCDITASLIGNALFIVAVRRSPMTMVVPLLALIPVLTLALGTVMLGEGPSGTQMIGVGLSAAGVFVLYLPPHAGLSPVAMWHNFRREPGAAPMLAVALAWALTAPLDKMAVAGAGVGLHGLVQVSLLWVAVTAWLLFAPPGHRPGFRVAPGAWIAIIGAGLTAGVSYGLQLAAYSVTLVAFAESIKRVMEIGAALVVGAIVFRETITRTKVAGIGLIALGVPLMLLPSGG